MAKAASDRADVYAGSDQLSGVICAEFMNRGPNSKTTRQPSVPLRHRVRLQVGSTVRVAGEHERLLSQFNPERSCPQSTAFAVLSELENGFAVKNDAAIRLILGVFLPRQRAVLAYRAFDVQDALAEIQVTPPDTAQFPSPVSGDHRERDQRAPIRILPRLSDDRAASAADGGRGFGLGADGGSAKSKGLTDTHLRRTARRKAPLRI
jgi:hypothetical protein